MRDMGRILGVLLLAAGLLIATGPATARASSPPELSLPGPAFFPESISAGPGGELFVSSLTTGEIVRFAPGSSEPTTFVAAGVNVGTAGVMVDPERNVLWACAVDLSFQTPSELRAFDLTTGALVASYAMPDGGVCGDIALAGRDVYVTDTVGGRIVRLTGLNPDSVTGGALTVWSADPQLSAGPPMALQINGITFDGDRTLYTTNYTTGELFAVSIAPDGSAQPAVRIALDKPLRNPDGIRWHEGYLYVAENGAGLSRVDPRTGTRTVIDHSLREPTSLVFVGCDIWITEGQVLRLQAGKRPKLPFKVVRRSVCSCRSTNVRSGEGEATRPLLSPVGGRDADRRSALRGRCRDVVVAPRRTRPTGRRERTAGGHRRLRSRAERGRRARRSRPWRGQAVGHQAMVTFG
jgi:sugar lactone lactonase YvrE